MKYSKTGRREFLKNSIKTAIGMPLAASIPTIVPSSVFGKYAPSNRINIAAIGNGRISRIHDIPGIWQYPQARLVAVCDVDQQRALDAKTLIDQEYSRQEGKAYDGVKVYHDYRTLMMNKDIDAVLISTPDHSHAMIAMAAANAGKHIYLQKPASLTIKEGRIMTDLVQRSGVKFQIGSQQRSQEQFRYEAELVRNGRIGKLKNVYVGLPVDPSGGNTNAMEIPASFNYDMWLGTTPAVYYTEDRVHPQKSYDRPGWLRCEQFGSGMITGWGAHHIDSAHWAMGMEHSGPIKLWGNAAFPKKGLWDVHGAFTTYATYSDGVTMTVSSDFQNGIRFEGTEGWIFVSRGDYQVTASDPNSASVPAKKLDASNLSVLQSVIGPNEIHLPISKEHHWNWLESILENKTPIAPAEDAHRACSACLLHHIAMKLGRKLFWNPTTEQFLDDDEADAMLSRPQRSAYSING
ncbi:MAG: Gfo/Idh/MocA family protein [Chitinophagaceae bacterium]